MNLERDQGEMEICSSLYGDEDIRIHKLEYSGAFRTC